MSFTSGNDTNILQATDSTVVGAGLGDDIYIVSEATISDNQEITISDTNGINTLQLIEGLNITSSSFANDAVQLTLSNGAVITVLGASAFSFDVGGNALLGTTGTVQDFATFASDTMETSIPAEGEDPVQGGGTTIGTGVVTPPVVEPTPGNTFTLTEATISRDILLQMDVTPIVETVTYWGFSNIDDVDGVPNLPEEFQGLNAIPLTELVNYVQTLAGLDFVQLGLINVANGQDDGLDSGDASDGDGATQIGQDLSGFSITNNLNLEPDANGNIDATITLEFNDGTIHEAEVAIAEGLYMFLENLLYNKDDEGNITSTRLFERTFETWPQIPVLDENGEPMYDAEGNLITQDFTHTIEVDQEEVFVPITLTPSENNGGTVEEGFTSSDDDTLVVGRLDLLHQAYIDGGEGDDTLEIDAKGHFAQPLQLLNIEHVSITNLPNIYDYEELTPDNLDDFNYGRENDGYYWSNPENVDQNSIIDLNRASSLTTVTITESGYNGLVNGDGNALALGGSLTVAGIRNGADLNLQGGFSQDLNLFYTEGNTGNGLNIFLANVDFSHGDFNIAHNANTFNLVSNGGDNYLNAIKGLNDATLSTINVSGEAFLQIADVAAIYNNENQRLATFDASENTGGVNIGFIAADQGRINFIGSQADDVLTVADAAATDEITITNAAGANRYDLNADELISITDATGNNEYLLNLGEPGGVVSVTAEGEGSNELELIAPPAEVITLNLDGDRNSAEINAFSEELNVTTPGDRNLVEVTGDVDVVNAQMTGDRNSLEIDGDTQEVTAVLGDRGVVELEGTNETVNVTLEGGDGMVFADEADDVTISAVDGGNTFDVIAENISITAGGDDNMAYVSGTEEDAGAATELEFDNGVLLDVNMSGTLYIGHPDGARYDGNEAPGVTALEGSVIAGQNLDIFVEAESNLTQAALSGIDSVEINDTLRMNVEQFLAIGPEAFAAYQEEFGAKQSLELVVNSDTDLTDVDLSSLRLFANNDVDSFAEAGVELSFFIAKGAELTLTAQQLHENVAATGIEVLEADVIGGLLGSVVITEAGLEFDPWGLGDDYQVGGTLSGNFDGAVNVTIERDGDFERPEVQDPSDVYPIVVTEVDQTIDGLETQARTIEITGEGNLTFTDTLDAVNLETLDFSELVGNLNGLTIEHFNHIEEVKGNNSDTRINVELEGDVATVDEGLVSSGVETYVVTELNENDRTFWTCETTENLVTLGLQGNYGYTLTFGNVDHGVNFLMEAVYDKANGSAVVGELVGEFARPGATAVVDVIDAEGRLADGESIMIEGIVFENAADITVNVAGGDAVIEAIAVDQAESLTLTSADDLTLDLDGAELDGLTSLDADGVLGDMTLFVDGDTDLSELTTLDGIDQVLLTENAELSLTIEQATAIGSDNFVYVGDELQTADLTLTDLNDQIFSLADYADGITVNVQIADEETVTLHPDTDMTGFGTVTVGEDTTFTLSGDQLVQLVSSGGDIDGTGRVVVTDFTQDHVDSLRDWAAEEEQALDFSEFLADTLDRVNLQVSGDLELGGFEDADNAPQSVVLGGLDDVLRFDMNGSQLTLVTVEQADGLLLNDGNVKFTFVDADTSIDMAGYTNIGEVEVYALLINRNDNIEDLFHNLASSVQDLENVIRVVDTPVGLSLDRAIIVDAGVTTTGDMQFITPDDADRAENVGNVWINLAGDSTIEGGIVLDANGNLAEGTFDTLTIVSFGDEANTITGGITADGSAGADGDVTDPAGVTDTAENNLLNVVIDADADLVIEGPIVFQSINAMDDEATATLTLTGEGDVTLTGLDTSDLDVDNLTINMENLDGNLTLTDTGDLVDYNWTAIEELTIIGNSAANPIVLGEDVVLNLTAEQANGLIIVPADGADTATITVNIIELENDVTYDFTGINADIAGQIELAETELNGTSRIQLEEGTDLGDFSVLLDDEDLIGFATPDQADGQVVNTTNSNGDNNGNIAWLFDELNSVIDASGYSSAIERLFINDSLAIDDPAVEQFWSGLAPAIELINIRYTGDLNFGVVDIDRTFEVSGFAQLTSGLDLLEGEDARFYDDVTIQLGGGANVESLTLNNFIDPALAGDEAFDTLTIESGSFDATEPFDPITNVFAPDNWDPDAGFAAPTGNTIGDIASGADLSLLDVVLETTNAFGGGSLPLNVGTITFDGDITDGLDPAPASLTVHGNEPITVESLVLEDAGLTANNDTVTFNIGGTGFLEVTNEISINGAAAGTAAVLVTDLDEDADIEAVNFGANIDTAAITNNGGGDLVITGGSPALTGANLESLVITAAVGVAVEIGSLDEADADNFWGIEAPNLTSIDTAGLGAVVVILDSINGDEFTYTAGAALGGVVLDHVALAAGGEWTFDLGALGAGFMAINGNSDFSNGGTLNIDAPNGELNISGTVDLTTLDVLAVSGANLDIILIDDAELSLTTDQLDAINGLAGVNFDRPGEGTGQLIVTGDGDLTGLNLADADQLIMTGDATLTEAQFELFVTQDNPATADVDEFENNINKGTGDLTVELGIGSDISTDDTSMVDVLVTGTGNTVTMAQLGILVDGSGDPVTADYSLNDTWANLSDPANYDAVAGADAYDISDWDDLDGEDLGNLTAQQAGILVGAGNYDAPTAPDFTVESTWADWQQLVTDAEAGDTGAIDALTAAIAGDFEFDITDIDTADFSDISVAEAALLVAAGSYDAPTHVYSVNDTAENVFNVLAYLDEYGAGTLAILDGADTVHMDGISIAQYGVYAADTYTLVDTWDNLQDGGNNAVRDAADSYEISDIADNNFTGADDGDPATAEIGVLTVANGLILTGASNFAVDGGAFDVADINDNYFVPVTGAFVDGVEDMLNQAEDVTFNDTLGAVQAINAQSLTNSGDKTYDIQDVAADIRSSILFAGADFSEATAIVHTGVGLAANPAALGTDTVEDTFAFDGAADSNTTITNFEAGASGDILDVTGFLGGAPAAINAVQTSNPGAPTLVEGDINRLVDIAGNQDITTAGGLETALDAGGEYANIDMAINETAIFITAADSNPGDNFVFYGVSDGLGAITVTLVGTLDTVDIDDLHIDNF